MGHLYDIFNSAITDDLIMEIALRNIPGHFAVRKFFQNPDMAASVRADLWDYGGTVQDYVYTTTPADYYIASDDNADTQLLQLFILDENYDTRVFFKSLQGQTPVKINEGFQCRRIFRMSNQNGTNLAGQVVCTEGSNFIGGVPQTPADVRAYINDGNNQTLMAHFTIPNGFYGLLYDNNTSIIKKQVIAADVTTWIRNEGGVFRLQNTVGINTVGTGNAPDKLSVPERLDPKTDVVIRAETDGTCGISGNYIIILVAERFVNKVSFATALS